MIKIQGTSEGKKVVIQTPQSIDRITNHANALPVVISMRHTVILHMPMIIIDSGYFSAMALISVPVAVFGTSITTFLISGINFTLYLSLCVE